MIHQAKQRINKLKLTTLQRLILAILILITLVRPIALLYSPPGFYVDEAIGAANIISVRETGKNLKQESLPLYTLAGGGGFVTPTYMYSAVAWSEIFGDSEYAFRLHSLFYTLLAILLLMYVAYLWWGRDASLLTGIAASLMPWSWHQGVLAWDPALIPFWVGLILAGWSYIKTRHWSNAAWGVMLAGFVGAAYTYPPTRITVAILGPILILSLWRQLRTRLVAAIVGILLAGLSMIPLLQFSLTPTALGRAGYLTVWGAAAQQNLGVKNFWDGLLLAAKNMAQLCGPAFLFFNGDPNLRHSAQTGMLGVGSLGILVGTIATLIKHRSVAKRDKKNPQRTIYIVIGIGILAAYLGSALTWEGQPHGLRSVAAWPFFALMLGWGLARIFQAGARYSVPVLMIYGIATSLFLWHYYTQFIEIAGPAFDQHVRPGFIESAKLHRQANEVDYVEDAYTYYLIRYGGKTF